MRPIQYERAADTATALGFAQRHAGAGANGAVYFAGGTTLPT